MEKKVSIIIPTLNGADYIRDNVKSIQKNVKREDYEILVVDDGSSEEEHNKLVDVTAELKVPLITNGRNGGYGEACNLGLNASSQTMYKLFFNNDMTAENDFITPLIDRIEKTKDCGIVGAKLLYPNGTIQFAGHMRNPFSPKWFDHQYRGQDGNFLPANKARVAMSVTGACLFVADRVLKEIEEKFGHYGYDPKYPMAFEDVDLCFKARRLGYQCWYEPAAVLTHIEGGTRGVGQKSIEDPRQQESIRQFWKYWTEEEVDEFSKLGY